MKFGDFLNLVKPYTMTSEARIRSLFDSLEYIRNEKIYGDIVECGVWKGGNMLGAIEYIKFHGMMNKVWLYDTFSGMTVSSNLDVDINGQKGNIWEGKCECSLEDVKNLIDKTNYKNVMFVIGDINETLNEINNIPQSISILRLDTDWYESTKKEMNILYPKLVNNGILIVDDYGHWRGSKQAVDEYFEGKNILIESIDYTGIKIIKRKNC
jgi:hypothetical protein